jgi:hypothetical protein
MIAVPDSVVAPMRFWPADAGDITTHPPHIYDMRSASDSYAPKGMTSHPVVIRDARSRPDPGLDTAGFTLVDQPTAVQDFYDADSVMQIYYDECKTLARRLTGASHAYTWDHLIREPGRQISGGGTDGVSVTTGAQQGGGYVGAVHMDYTERTTWTDYLAVHGEKPPADPKRIIALNFWRPVSERVENNPLAVCDARTVRAEDLYETVVHGYGAPNYSWHNLGIETYNVKYSPRHDWYFYPLMRSSEVLVFKSFDSDGVIGRTCPHGSFTLPDGGPLPRRSIELRVLCYVT